MLIMENMSGMEGTEDEILWQECAKQESKYSTNENNEPNKE